jgi:CRP-like cAMP-binding protein
VYGGGTAEVRNRILLALPSDVRAQVLSACDPVEISPGRVIYPAGGVIENVYFINGGLVSLVKAMEDGRSVEVGAVGVEGLAGLFGGYGSGTAVVDYTAQIPVTALRISRAALQNEISRHEALRRLIEGYLFLLAKQLAQVAACNRLHSLEQRFCRWLLVAHDNAFSDRFVLVHEHLALLLGIQRPSLSVTANRLRQRGLIRYAHGWVTILDRAGIGNAACECYHTNRAQIEVFFNLVSSRKSA